LQSYLAQLHLQADVLDLNNYFYNFVESVLKKEWLKSCNTNLEENMFSLLTSAHSQQLEQALNKLLQYDIIGFSCFKSNLKTTLEFIKLIKCKKSGMRIVLGGPEMACRYFKENKRIPDFICEHAGFIVVGEGELALAKFLSGRSKSSMVLFEQLPHLSELSFPSYRGLELSSYPKKRVLPLQFSRGCIRRCDFCSERLLHKGMRIRPVKNIIEEIRFHKSQNDIENFIFFDSLINADLKKLEQLCDAIINRFGSINWEAQCAIRCDMPERLLAKMKQSGCYNLFVGLESGADGVLQRMHKGFTVKQAQKFFRKLKKADLSFGISLIVGYPDESEREFKKSIDFVIKNQEIIPKIEQLNPFTYYEGTRAEKSADYKTAPKSLNRMRIFAETLKSHGIKYTNAYIGNLIEK